MVEIIDRFQPDLLYSDGALPFDTHGYEAGLAAVAHRYNTSAALHDGVNQAIYNQKDRNPEVYRVGSWTSNGAKSRTSSPSRGRPTPRWVTGSTTSATSTRRPRT